MSIKRGMQRAWHKFLQTNFNVFMRSGQNLDKQRKYQHIEIQQQFQDMENERKKQRLLLIEYKKKMKKKLIEQQLDYLNKQKELGIINSKGYSEEQKQLLEETKKLEGIKTAEQFDSVEQYAKEMMKKQLELKNENAQTIYKITSDKDEEDLKEELMIALSKINSELEQIKVTKQELEQVNTKIEELEPDYILITGMKKQLVLNQIAYYEFQSRNLQGFNLHPETMKAIEKIHYDVDHNIPVKRELLFEVCPELFEAELETMEKIERDKILAKRPRLDSNDSSVIKVTEKYPKHDELPKPLHPLEQIKVDEYEMRDFVYRKCGQFAQKWAEHIYIKREAGFANVHLVLENIELKPEEKLTEEEKELKKDLQELKKINQDFAHFCELLKEKAIQEQKKLQIPEFVKQNKKLEAAWIEKWETLVGNSYEFSESLLIPDNSNTNENQFDHILQEYRRADIKSLIEQSNEEYKKIVGGDEPVRARDPKEKNVNLIQKLNILSEVMNQLPEREERKLIPQFVGQVTYSDHPEEKRILLTEMTKILFLNNQNPKKYNVEFWANHFNLEPQKLRNIFNYISYAIPDVTNEKETGKVFRFIYES
ncbi:hypothetical protein TTHERM_00727790 (macronuclear) [Tetrahymena thermophila SB210]|uniref:Uncharacterized protein n=1 Tax=Tetrahymena thermophila (strain SB210) TaxID=312017 RepID=I7MLJ6_TETTS|nr:hypothetical protein TTHERM_00727790 [Tetrahymena thermophila SB210]EAS02419.1 hypothetical protein TTHERM_00727790 [Tetrahymena thermophila SB210]|eukprot:XP_001022664.1 hypothetical protein TTHERM_00727790 [Tetrahymena thermophila SB210]